ncbi:hypothetical protein Ciccas_000162 [Cichlidogyrus casuarinus]|uniref:Uncharacterized protein n=1 Tax=Cichlidogyrus casuarinus TaxID=1844966 RepID=A0ABD2QNR5_9PLAT
MVEHFTKKYGTVTEGGVRAMTASESLAKSKSALMPNHNILSRRIQDYMGDRWANFQRSFNHQYQQQNASKNNTSGNATVISSGGSNSSSKNGPSASQIHKTPSNRVPSLEVCQAKTTTVSFAAEDEAATRLLTNESATAELDEGEGPDFCGMCGQLEPPASSLTESEGGAEETQVIDWTRCDFCNRWVHLNSVCSRGSIIGENDFMCKICNQQRQANPPSPKRPCSEEDSLEEEIITLS